MIISCVLPLLIVASFGAVAPPLSRKVRPGLSIWMLSVGGLTLTICGVVALGVVAALGLGQLAPLARLGHWSPQTLGLNAPFQTWSMWTAVVLVVLAAARATSSSWAQGRRLRAPWSTSRAAPAGLIVLADDEPFAYAVPGWPGRIVISRGLLQSLDPAGRRAVLAHEQTHLAERHDLHHLAMALAAAINPLLLRLPAALQLACERRADEVAAQTVGHRGTVARAITTAVGPHIQTLTWAASGADVPVRVAALLCPPRDNRLVSSALLVATLGAVAMSTASVFWLGHDLRSLVIMARR
jgi:Zn-dependent protease with chaperone function